MVSGSSIFLSTFIGNAFHSNSSDLVPSEVWHVFLSSLPSHCSFVGTKKNNNYLYSHVSLTFVSFWKWNKAMSIYMYMSIMECLFTMHVSLFDNLKLCNTILVPVIIWISTFKLTLLHVHFNITHKHIYIYIYMTCAVQKYCLSPRRRYTSRDVNNNSINSAHGHQPKGTMVL